MNFDISGIDLANFPEVDCHDSHTVVFLSCDAWKLFPELRIASARFTYSEELHMEIKALPDEETERIAFAREFMLQRDPEMAESELHVRAVGHDFGDLHRWKTIIDRFAHSDGNSVGILKAQILPFDIVLTSGPIARPIEPAGYWNQLTIHVETFDTVSTTNALPILLPQLGIPSRCGRIGMAG